MYPALLSVHPTARETPKRSTSRADCTAAKNKRKKVKALPPACFPSHRLYLLSLSLVHIQFQNYSDYRVLVISRHGRTRVAVVTRYHRDVNSALMSCILLLVLLVGSSLRGLMVTSKIPSIQLANPGGGSCRYHVLRSPVVTIAGRALVSALVFTTVPIGRVAKSRRLFMANVGAYEGAKL